jgi:hypothetical protein
MSSFTTNPVPLEDLLKDCAKGAIQLPEFQRAWVWDDERIRSLIASVSQQFPIGALMTLKTGGPVKFKPRSIQGTPAATGSANPRELLLDGQQRMTSLYQTCMGREVINTITKRGTSIKRWYYLDMQAALNPNVEREEAIIGLPEDRIERTEFGRIITRDLSSREKEFENLMFPVNLVLDWDEWQESFGDYWIGKGDPAKRDFFKAFKNQVLQGFKSYQIPVISLDETTSREAVCLVFEKVNTGGKALDAFELVTAMYATDEFDLRRDWFGGIGDPGRFDRLRAFGRAADQKFGLLEKIANTEFLQAISLLHTKAVREAAKAKGVEGRDLPAVSATRQSLLSLELDAYKKYADIVEEGFRRAAKFLRLLRINRVIDIPYQSQLVPLAAILAEIGDQWENAQIRAQLSQWLWNGVFGELYGGAIETRFAKDVVEVPAWLSGGTLPSTIRDAVLRADRLKTMRSRLSAAYKGVNALLMQVGAKDFRSGQDFDQTVFFDEDVDIHHIFPRDWCLKKGIKPAIFDSIINKTPLGYRTNRIIGGVAPSQYLARLQEGWKGSPPIQAERLDEYLSTHLIDPALIRADAFDGFMADRQKRLLDIIEKATGQKAYTGDGHNEPEAETDASEESEQLAAE